MKEVAMAGGEAESLELRPLYLVDDEPVPGYKHDGLDLRQFADVVAGTALGTTGPFTIGVYADWGQGKSSLLNQARSMLQATNRANVVTVMFNAWRYEREEHPIVPLVATIERALAEHLEKHQSALQKASASAWKFLHAARRKARGLIAGLTLGAKGEATVPMLGKLELELGWSAKDAKECERELTEAEKNQWESWVQRCLYLSAFDRLDELTAQAFGGNDNTEDQPRIVVFIDDLDRCLPDKAFELIENIKLVLGQKGFVFVLALNRAVIDAYLRKLAVDRYGEERADLLDRYLDKIVQLPLPLPSHRERFKNFVTWVIKERLKEADQRVFNELADLLRMGTTDTPRMLVRRHNTLLVDQRLREGMKKLKGDLGNEQRPYKEFLGLCIVQRTLQDVLEASVLKGLSEDQKLCDLVAEKGVAGSRNWIIERNPAHRGEGVAKATPLDSDTFERWNPVITGLRAWPFLEELFKHASGQRWLKTREARVAVSEFVSERPEEPPASTGEAGAGEGPSRKRGKGPAAASQEQIIARAVREALKLPSDAELTGEVMQRVTELNLFSEPITDEGVKELARADTGLKKLSTLFLAGTQVTDAAVKELARADTGLKNLSTLALLATQVTDAGVKELARADTGLKNLSTLYLLGTQVTAAAVKELRKAKPNLQIWR